MILTIVYDVQYNEVEVINMDSMNELLSSLSVELKRGTMVLLVLSQLRTNEYGYSLVQKLEEKNAPIEAGTLYPLLRRLEKQNLLKSEWDTSESRPRKFYTLSEEGKEVYTKLKEEWRSISNLVELLLKEDEENETN
ncbi:MAG: PadR family transcriptional regulator [Herbinix sp.]|jgi:DNA-binding PadR family transcriptional regulator|nr:PadR family transcriptional regulator [Herbinix sp.]